MKLLRKEYGIANNSNWPAFVYDFFKSDREKLFLKRVLRVSSWHPNTSKQKKTLGLRPRAFICFSVFGYPDETLALVLKYLKDNKGNRLHLGQKYLVNKLLQAAGMSTDNACFEDKCESLRTISHSPGHNQKWMYDFLYSDWLTGNQNIA